MKLIKIPGRAGRGYTLVNEAHIVKVEVCLDESLARAYGSPLPTTLPVGIYLATGETVWAPTGVLCDFLA
jgi:hypothetical protein